MQNEGWTALIHQSNILKDNFCFFFWLNFSLKAYIYICIWWVGSGSKNGLILLAYSQKENYFIVIMPFWLSAHIVMELGMFYFLLLSCNVQWVNLVSIRLISLLHARSIVSHAVRCISFILRILVYYGLFLKPFMTPAHSHLG